ncbi:MAG: DUF1963 domain-containing protein [Eubacteriales bacterium]
MEKVDYSMVETVLAKMNEFQRESVVIEIAPDNTPEILDSKFGGQPYIPRSVGKAPMTTDGELLRLLAQFNLSQLPQGVFPAEKGILQFFIDCTDDLYGADFDDWTCDTGYKVIFYPEIESAYLSREEITELYVDYEEEYAPIDDGEWGLVFTKKVEELSLDDYRFDDLFKEIWNERYPEHTINSAFDLSEEFYSRIYDERGGMQHKLLGYPGFTQCDPREYNDEDKQDFELLFQMDSDFGKDVSYEIMWGDAGIANFFIKPTDLEKLDFSNVAYNWDCS